MFLSGIEMVYIHVYFNEYYEIDTSDCLKVNNYVDRQNNAKFMIDY